MDQQLMTELRQQLETKKQTLTDQLNSIGSQVSETGDETNFDARFPDYGDSLEDSATEVADYTKNLSLERDLERDIHGVEKALESMDKGTYGTCSYCGKEIEIERLKARPESTSCVECKQALKY